MSRHAALSERDAWIALASTTGVGDLTFERLLAAYGSARQALHAVAGLSPRRADRELAKALGMRQRVGLAAEIRSSYEDPDRAQRATSGLHGWTLTPGDAGYPTTLRDIEAPPLVIYGQGDQDLLCQARAVAVVGTRRPTPTARDLAHRIARRLVEVGAVVVSGLAVGIDGAAHRAALEAGGKTVAVIGGGLDAPGPAAHRQLARSIARRGAVISELAPGVTPTHGTFPRRNRIISGLAMATIVVEAPARSGALITARHALEQGRQVIVAPGRPLDRRIAGNLALLRESPAIPMVGLDEMVRDLGLHGANAEAMRTPMRPADLSLQAALASLGEQQRMVAKSLSDGPKTVDRLCAITGMEPGVVAAAITILQLRGWARVLGTTMLPSGPLLAEPGA